MEQLLEQVSGKVKLALAAGLAVLVMAGLGFGFLTSSKTEEEVLLPTALVSQTTEADELESEEVAEPDLPILVDVKGAVVKEGVYELATGSRVTDAVKLAGGFLEGADPNSVNLAQKLVDEMVIYVAYEGEEVASPVMTNSGASAISQGGKVNINTADLGQLQTITGIGEKRAQEIIAYREAHGRFQSLEDLTKISGIGAKTLDKIREEISLD